RVARCGCVCSRFSGGNSSGLRSGLTDACRVSLPRRTIERSNSFTSGCRMSEQRKVVTQSPENSETPLADVHGWVTPTRLFFVRNHFDVPEIDAQSWRLSVGGCVGRPLELTW